MRSCLSSLEMVVGISILMDFSGVVDEKFHSATYWEFLLEQVIKVGHLTKLEMASHQFEKVNRDSEKNIRKTKGGATAFALLSESHISVHTWPEYNQVVIDVFTCGKQEHLDDLIDFLKTRIKHFEVKITKLKRGDSS